MNLVLVQAHSFLRVEQRLLLLLNIHLTLLTGTYLKLDGGTELIINYSFQYTSFSTLFNASAGILYKNIEIKIEDNKNSYLFLQTHV